MAERTELNQVHNGPHARTDHRAGGSPQAGWIAVAATAIWTALAVGCGDGPTDPPPDPPRPTTVTVTPASTELAALGATVQLTAQVFDQYGEAMSGASVSWTSGDAQVATVDGSGLVESTGNGSATITATSGSASGTSAVTVAQVVAEVAVSPGADTLVALGDTVRFAAEAADANGHAVAGAELTWSSGDAQVATVDGSGLVESVGNGAATITATAGSASGTATVTVAQVVAAVAVSPGADTLAAFGDTVRFAAEAADANGHAVAGAEFTWSSSDAQVATVDGLGLVESTGNGAATITATAGSASGTATVTVAQVVASVAVSPGADTLVAFGDTVRFAAEATDANGHAVAEAEFTWSSSDAEVATVDGSGMVESVGRGSTTITATSGSASGTAEVTVAQVVASVAVSPGADTLVAFGDTVRFAAEATDANGHAVAGAEFTWSSSDAEVATVDGSGLVESRAAGGAVITATTSDVTGEAELRVVPALPTTVEVRPDSVGFSALGRSEQLLVEVRDQAGRVMAEAFVSWSSGDTLVAAVDSAGVLTAVGRGTATVTAASGDASDTVFVIVMQSTGSVVVSPPADTILLGDTLRLAAEALDDNGNVIDGAAFEWSSSDVSVARVDALGLVTALAEGRATITAVAGEASGAAEVTVENPDRAALVALYNTTDGPNWVDNTNWMTDAPLEEWSGVSTSAAGRVWSIELQGNRLSGRIPAELGALSHLMGLSLYNNDLSGPIPPELGGLSNLEWLSLSHNDLSGPIPPELGGLSRLLYLTIYANDLSGPIPPELGALSNLRTLWLYSNGLSGPIPPELGRLSNLVSLELGRNDLSGPIPPELGRLSNLERLDLSGNQLSGLPPELGRLSNLEYLDLNSNQLSGLPPELGDLSNLVTLNLAFTDLSGLPPELGDLSNLVTLDLKYNDLSGLPPELGGLSNLEYLDLRRNDLSGLPPELGGLSNLEYLDLAFNDLSGLPPELGRLSNLRELVLRDNDLSGPIPPELGGLSNLVALNLYGMSFHGPIPPELGGLSNLRELVLSGNDLSGPIPPELGGLSNLKKLSLGWNDLSGPIPPELGDLSNLEVLWLNDNDLSGPIPPELGDLSNLEVVWLDDNDLSGPIPPELGGLGNLRWLTIMNNDLEGVLPRTFLDLSLVGGFGASCGDPLVNLCVPGTTEFVEWMDQVGVEWQDSIRYCNEPDRAALATLFEATGGREWTESDGWLGKLAIEEWHGVSADTLGRVTALHLSDNGLSGSLPGDLSQLAQVVAIRIGGNAVEGRLPLTLTSLALREFHYDGTELCEPEDDRFRRWVEGIESHKGTGVECAALTDRDVLEVLYRSTGGRDWRLRRNWLSDRPVGDWHGVEVNGEGRVVSLGLRGNGLSGSIPPELGALSHLEWLILPNNDLSGSIPPELGGLTRLSGLSLPYNDLSGPIPPELGGLSRLVYLLLPGNDVSGPIPPELGGLSNMTWLDLEGNDLSGPIPPELGGLSRLSTLSLADNALSGPIPAELGGLSRLSTLSIPNNALSGPIPAELGRLSRLSVLSLPDNALSGPIPAELGRLSNLKRMELSGNALSGPIPPEFGGLASLRFLDLARNEPLAGPLPESLTSIRLESLQTGGTDLCTPILPSFMEWLLAIPRQRITLCGEPPAAYLVQTVQSRAHPVPLLAEEDALLRVFVTAALETTAGIPEVRARFYLNGTERHVAEIPASSTPIPTEIDEGNLSKSANAKIPGEIVRPGLEMVVEIDPGGTLDPGLGVAARIPEEGRLAIVVREAPTLDLTVIPFLWESDPDSAIIGMVEGMADDPEGHALLEETHVLLPVADIDVTAHAPVASTSDYAHHLLAQTEAIRVLEGGGGHYMGTMSDRFFPFVLGVAYLSGRSSYSDPRSDVIAHELGHNMSLSHAPCGGAGNQDPWFPYRDGDIGAWGYDQRLDRLVPTTRKDHMTYCNPTWTSDYHFANALAHRLVDEGISAAAQVAAPTTSLLLWGGVDTTGTPFLNPSFVVEAPPALPDSAGDWTVTGRNAGGAELFSLSFAMPLALTEEADVSSFVFALPARPGWSDALASVTLSGPAGTATLDGDSDMPMAILRDPVTGQVRGFLDDLPDPGELRLAGGLELIFSRGIPDASAWRR